MKVDVSRALRAIKILPDDDGILKGPDGKDTALRQVLTAALVSGGPRCHRCGLVQFPSDTQDGETKFRRWMLAQRIEKAKKHVEFSNDEVTMLKNAVADNQSVIVSGQVWELLDPVTAKQHEEKEAKKRKPEKPEEPE